MRTRWTSAAFADALSLALIVLAAAAWSLFLDRFPTVSDDEPWIAAPGIGLFEHGRYASDSLEGWHGAERAQPSMPPVEAVLAGLSTRLFGLGLWQVRLVSLAFGLATLFAVRALARALLSPWAAVVALVLLTLAVLSPPGLQYPFGVPLADVARRARYDVPVAALFAWGLWFCLRRVGETRGNAALGGACAALALASHPQGAAVLLALAAAIVSGEPRERKQRLLALGAGFTCTLLPWLVYLAYYRVELVAQLADEPRFGLTRLWQSLATSLYELRRYSPVAKVAHIRMGPWIWMAALLGGTVRAARSGASATRGLLAAVLVVVTLQALFLRPWLFHYAAPLWGPFALLAACGVQYLARWSRLARVLAVIACGIVAVEGGRAFAGIVIRARDVTPYADLCAGLAKQVPEEGRVLGPPAYWLGLKPHVSAYLSTSGPIGLTREQPGQAAIFENAAERWQPSVVLLDPPLRAFLRRPDSVPEAFRDLAWQMRTYVDQHFQLASQYDDPTYGRFEIWLRRP